MELYITEQAKNEISHSVISPVPQLFLYEMDSTITNELSNVYNNALIQLLNKYPKNFSAFCTVPLNDPEKAAITLHDSMKKGIKGAIIGPGINDKLLSDDFFIPFFEVANDLHAIIFIHPLLNNDPRIKKKKMSNLIGVPWETTLCALDLVLSGFLDKYPNIRILLAHGGGFLPYQLGRINKGYEMWTEVSSALMRPPSDYLKRMWYDTVLWNKNSLQLLISTVGKERVVSGSDFPFDLSEWPPEVTQARGASSLLGKNAKALK